MIKKDLYVTEEQVKALQGLKDSGSVTVSEHIRRAIDMYLKDQMRVSSSASMKIMQGGKEVKEYD